MRGQGPSPDELDRFWELCRDLLAVADLDGRFVHVSDRWTEVTGWSAEELRSRPFIEFVHPDDRADTLAEAEAMAASGRASTSFENRYRCKDGSWVWLLWNSFTDTAAGRIHAVATDITARRSSEQRLDLLRRVALAANEADELGEALRRVLGEVRDTTGWSVGHAYLCESTEGDPVLVPSDLWTTADGTHMARLRDVTVGTSFGKDEGLPGRAWAAGEPQWVADVVTEPWWVRQPVAELGVRAAIAAPVRSGTDTVAVLEFFDDQPQQPDEELLDLLAAVGTQAGRVHERQQAIRAEQEVVATERRFLSMLSHELRSPLVSIRGFAGLVLDRWDDLGDTERRGFIERVSASAVRMHRLVDEFLQLARHHQEGFEPRTEQVRLRRLVDDVLEEIGPDLRRETVMDVDDGVTARADRHFTTQILLNLLTNARRHGSPPIEIHATADEARVTLTVRDHGDGVPDDFRAHLFTRFARANREGPGTGLGLSIARDLAVAQDGRLRHEPADPGAAFVLTLPTAP